MVVGSARPERLGVAIVGMGGAVATTAIAGIEMIKSGSNRLDGLPLAGLSVAGLADYKDLVFGGWDLNGDDLAAPPPRATACSRRTTSRTAPRR